MSKFSKWFDRMLSINPELSSSSEDGQGQNGQGQEQQSTEEDEVIKIVEKPDLEKKSDIEERLKNMLEAITKKKPFAFDNSEETNYGNTDITILQVNPDNQELLRKQKVDTLNIAKIERDLRLQSVKIAIDSYDYNKQAIDSKYKPYEQILENEVDAKDKDDMVDIELDAILSQKLDIYKEPVDFVKSEKLKKQLEEQALANKARIDEHSNRLKQVRDLIESNDAAKRLQDPTYVGFDENCDENEIENEVDTLALKKRFASDGIKDVEKMYLAGETPNILGSANVSNPRPDTYTRY